MTRTKRKRGNPAQVASCELASRVLWFHSVRPLLDAGLSQLEVAAAMNEVGTPTTRGKRWTQAAIAKLKAKYSESAPTP